MKRVGRQRGLTLGTFFGVVGALICATAITMQSFWLLCLGTLVWGVYNAFGQYYRFAAADIATPDLRANAISLVLAGGLVGGIVGPATSRCTIDLVQPKFMGAYLALIGFALRHGAAAALHPHPDADRGRARRVRPAARRDRGAAEIHRRGALRRGRATAS